MANKDDVSHPVDNLKYVFQNKLAVFEFEYLTEHPFTDRSALYRIPLELVKNRKLHNEMLFF